MKDDTNDFWQDVLGRVEAAQAEAPEQVTLEEAERRMAEAEDEVSLDAAVIERIVASATAPRVRDAGTSGGKVFGFPGWARRAVAASVLLAPLMAVAFWQALEPDARVELPSFDPNDQDRFPKALRFVLDPSAARKEALSLQESARARGETAVDEDLDRWTRDLRVQAIGLHVGNTVLEAIMILEMGQSDAAPGLAAAAQEALETLRESLHEPLPTNLPDPASVLSALKSLAASSTPPDTKVQLIRALVPQLELAIHAVRGVSEQEQLLEQAAQTLLDKIRAQLAN